MTQPQSSTGQQLSVRYGFVVLALLGAAWIVGGVALAPDYEKQVWAAARALRIGQYDEAHALAQSLLQERPDDSRVLVIAGDAAVGRKDPDQALAHYGEVPLDDSLPAYHAALGLAVRLDRKGHMQEAEHFYRLVLKKTPHLPLANKRLTDLLQIQGRTWEAIEFAMQILRQGEFGATELHAVACPENRIRYDKRYLKLAKRATPDDPYPLLADARIAALENRTNDAIEAYEAILELDKHNPVALFRLGRLFLDEGRLAEFIEIDRTTQAAGIDHPGIWFNRGIAASRAGQHSAAVKCLFETLKRWPNHVEANYAISQSLAVLNQAEAAGTFGERSRILARIEQLVPEFYDEPTEVRMIKLVDDFVQLGRYWEAAGICDFARRLSFSNSGPDSAWAQVRLRKLNRTLVDQTDVVVTPAPLERIKNLTSYSLPDWSGASGPNELDIAQPVKSPIRFENVASKVGLDFEYFNGSLDQRGMEHIFETTGGGIGAVDFDRDGWCDIYFTQGAPIWDGDDQVTRYDELFRNKRGQSFESVGLQSQLGDTGFGQGVTVCDYDADGFPDLYVGNLGGNRFYRNNGDGTFVDVTDVTGTAGDEWTLSCVLADFDGDALQDLYVVNYLDKDAVFERRCRKNGAPLTCAPTLFPAEQDRVYRNLGNGEFEEVTETSGVEVDDGKGLAVLAADFDQSGRLSVFVGNDTTPNFFFANESDTPEDVRFAETALLQGLALDGEGRSQATMGVACGDVNGDGLFDLFITNFYEDANTLYQQQASGFFNDATRSTNLFQPSYQMLGFGTEFLDADLDGRVDLFITNGHVDQTDATGEPDRMVPQFFRNDGNRFTELPASQLGPCFSEKVLGRTVSRLDWNQDGRDDLCVLSLYSPVALITNTTDSQSRSLQIRLVGTDVDRDAIGTTVRVVTDSGTVTQQLVAGDGYLTSNERLLTFGVGLDDVVDVVVEWPDGVSESYNGLLTGQSITIVQNCGFRPDKVFAN